MYLVFDVETSNFHQPNLAPTHPSQGRVLQLCCLLLNERFEEVSVFKSFIQLEEHVIISEGAFGAHGIDKETCNRFGVPLVAALGVFESLYRQCKVLVGHNIDFDLNMLQQEQIYATGSAPVNRQVVNICTMKSSTDLCKLPFNGNGKPRFGQKYKWPKLNEVLMFAYNEELEGAHDSLNDCRATIKVFRWLLNNNYINIGPAKQLA